MDYTSLVKPQIKNFLFPYGPDDNQAIKYEKENNSILFSLKGPITPTPEQNTDWQWFTDKVTLAPKLMDKLAPALFERPKRPDLRFPVLKGGLIYPVLQFAWQFPKIKLDLKLYPGEKRRVLAVDIGMVNLAASVICENGRQISQPYFYKRTGKDIVKIERLYKLLKQIQKKLDKYEPHAPHQGKRRKEFDRLQRKLCHIRKNECYHLVKHLLTLATQYRCTTIVLEDLRFFEPEVDDPKWSRRLNNWLRGTLWDLLEHKVLSYGIKLRRVNPSWTSSFCPRCGKRGCKVKTNCSTQNTRYGRMFYCPICHYRADRDYIAAINIYRKFSCLSSRYKKKSQFLQMTHARVVLYTRPTAVNTAPDFSLGPTPPTAWEASFS